MDDHPSTDTPGTLQTRRAFLRTSMLGAAAAWTLPVWRRLGIWEAAAA